MSIELRKEYAWSLLIPTSIGVRLTAANAQPMHCSDTFFMQATSAETNVASIASYLGLPVKVLTAFVKGSPISRFLRDNLAGRHMTVEAKILDQGGPWGYRHQFNLADSGLGARGPRVHNDRAGEVGRTLSAQDFDLERIFGAEGVQIVHLSGLIAALSSQTSTFCLELARAAKKHGTRISFDLNHRASFWKGRESELRDVFLEIAHASDILVGNEEDFQLCLGIEGPEAGGKDLAAKIDGFKGMIGAARKTFPQADVFATTLREVVSANCHRWGAIMLEAGVCGTTGVSPVADVAPDRRDACRTPGSGTWYVVEPKEIAVLDRIGGGDGFVGGMLYAILKGWPAEKWVQFGWACGALATTQITDYAQPADEEQVWSVWQGNARVRR
ncbi:MAG: 2-dehydro-3-deoxygluconokinase [Planctomycetes bacterium ADurb.Bin126]|nr:MAG: 2-dehydro-3-deoxygluconokinase [Planctomycetes bacterium ADurb.Bin126]